ESRIRWPQLATCEDATIEAIIGLWPEVSIHRTSIFDAVVKVVDQADHDPYADSTASDDNANVGTQFIASNASPTKKIVREKRSIQKKRITKEAAQGDLWGY